MRPHLCVCIIWCLLLVLITISTPERLAAAGKSLSLDVQQVDVRDVLRLIADVSGRNIIVSGDVQGTITTRLVDVPWEQALAAVLKLTGLAQESQGQVIVVMPQARFTSLRQERLRGQHAATQAEPLITRVVPLNYASASVMQAHLERLLGACATITADTRTNTLILRGTPSCLRLYQDTR